MNENLVKLTDTQIKQVIEKGYTYVMCPCGCGAIETVTQEQLLFDLNELKDYLK